MKGRSVYHSMLCAYQPLAKYLTTNPSTHCVRCESLATFVDSTETAVSSWQHTQTHTRRGNAREVYKRVGVCECRRRRVILTCTQTTTGASTSVLLCVTCMQRSSTCSSTSTGPQRYWEYAFFWHHIIVITLTTQYWRLRTNNYY